MSHKTVDIIITNYNGVKTIVKLLKSIEAQNYKKYNCFVIDDNSLDNSAEIVEKQFPWVKLIKQKKNNGPAKNRNIVIKQGDAPYIAIFDNDVFLSDTEWISKAVKKMESDDNIGQIATMIVSGFDEDTLIDCGIGGDGPLFGGIYHKKNAGDVLGKHDISRAVLGACTAGTILRRDVFEKIGGFDPRYYYLAEDLDLSLRIHLLGYNVIYEPSLITHHYESQAMGKRQELKKYLSRRNSLFAFLENYPIKYAINKTLVFFKKETKKIIKSIAIQIYTLRIKISFFAELKLYLKLVGGIIFNLPHIFIKRKKIENFRIRERQYLIEIGDKLEKEISLLLPVESLIYSITNICNARCKMCFQYRDLNKPMDLLTLNEIRAMVQSMPDLKNIVLGGGEPFLRLDIDQICKILIKNSNLTITIPTNGSMPDVMYEKVKKILSYGCKGLVISLSLDGMTKYHESNRNIPGLFAKIEECYRKLENLKKIYNDRLIIKVNSCFSKGNIDQIDFLFKYIVEKMPVAEWTFEPIRGLFNAENATPISIEDWLFISQKIEEFNKTGYLKTYEMLKELYQKSITTMAEKKQIVPCTGGKEFISIDYVGNIYPCEMMMPVANIRDLNYDINNILADEKWLKVREQIEKNKCYCTHFCWLSHSLSKNKNKCYTR